MSQLSDSAFSTRVGDLKQVLYASLIGGLLGGAINFLLYFGAIFLLGATFELQGPMPVTAVEPLMVAVASLIPALIGGLILYGLAQYQPENAFRIFVGLAIAIVVLSLYPPYDASVNLIDGLVLIGMHFVAMLSTVWGLYQFGMVRD